MGRGMDCGLRGPYMRLGPVIVLCSWARHVNLIVTLSAQENKQKGLGGGGGGRELTGKPIMTKLGVVTFSGLVSHPGVASCEGDWDKLQKLRWVY